MSRFAESRSKKVAVLQVIYDQRDILFATNNGSDLVKKNKEDGWQLVLRKAQSLCVCGCHRNWTYARDKLFCAWKSRTRAKLRRAKVKGIAADIDEVDRMILHILEDSRQVVSQGPGSFQTIGASNAPPYPTPKAQKKTATQEKSEQPKTEEFQRTIDGVRRVLDFNDF